MAAKDDLLRLLDDAVTIVSAYGEMNLFCGFDTGAEFAAELRSLHERVARNDWSALGSLVGIFAPTGAWDDGVGGGGGNIADQILQVLDQMQWSRRSKTCD